MKIKEVEIWLYILKMANHKLYTGITNNIARRLLQHAKGHSKSTKYHRPVILIHTEKHPNRKAARKQEVYIKNMGARKYLNRLFFEGKRKNLVIAS